MRMPAREALLSGVVDALNELSGAEEIDAVTCTRHVWGDGAMGFPDEWATQALVSGWIVEITSGAHRERWHVSDHGVARKWSAVNRVSDPS